MNKKELVNFLEKFNIKEDKIDEFVNGKSVIEKNKNYYLIKDKFVGKEIHKDILIFINLNGQSLISKYLLQFIKESTKNIIEIKNEKQALNFTYGKDLGKDSIRALTNLDDKKNYIVLFDDNILGYCYLDKSKKLGFHNLMNIGEYLKEN